MSYRPAEVLARYSGPAEIVTRYDGGRVLVVHFRGEPVRGWGYDVLIVGPDSIEQIGAGTNTQSIAESVARNYLDRCERAR